MKQWGPITLFLIIILIVTAFPVYGQESLRFHPDPKLFIQDVENLFGGKPPEEVKQTLQELEILQRKGRIEENQWIDLADKANLLDRLGGRPIQHINLLIKSFTAVISFSEQPNDYRYWSGQLNQLLANDQKTLNRTTDFLQGTRAFIREGILFQSTIIKWKVRQEGARFARDTAFHYVIRETSLAGIDGGDSTVIFSTSGRYYPEHRIWIGTGGEITWEPLGIPKEQLMVRINRYQLNLAQSGIAIDSVNLIDRRYFKTAVPGRVESKILYGMNPDLAGYPRFTAYGLDNRIKDIYPGMDYEGGYSLQGKRVVGTGLPEKRSTLQVFSGGSPLFRIASTHFVFQPDNARALNSEASIYLESDSIFHPGILFQYHIARDEITLSRDGKGLSASRFFNSYHDFDLDADRISWKRGDSTMVISGLLGAVENRAVFESEDFFNIQRYNEILIADKIHPVSAVKRAADFIGTRFYTLADLARHMDKADHLVEEMLLRLSFFGFVRYSTETKIVEVLDRTYDFIAKNAGLQDYDNLRFESVTKPPAVNAQLFLKSGRMKVMGVKEIVLSQSRHVFVYPTNQTVVLLKGRDLLFDGEIQGGTTTITGQDFVFSYSDFSVRMNRLNQLKLSVFELPPQGNAEPGLVEVTSFIEKTRGTLYIDHAENKSGLKTEDYPQYPVIATDTFSYVYYDRRDIVNGAYTRDSFFFRIDPFVMGGMFDLAFAESLKLPGRFETAGIFPPLELALTYQKDRSLGFSTLETPDEGL
ncbi:MAG: hypothetical protein R6V75_01145, partial [Bacteroidales bacterium]